MQRVTLVAFAVMVFAQAGLRDVLAGQVTLSYYASDTNCAAASFTDNETDPIGTCTTEAGSDGRSTKATLVNSGNSVSFAVYEGQTCSGNPVDTAVCGCDDPCCTFNSMDFTIDCTLAAEPAAEQVTIDHYLEASCKKRLATETDSVGFCEKEALDDQWSFMEKTGNVVKLSVYNAAGCSSGDKVATATCNCGDCCMLENDGPSYFKLSCTSSSKNSATHLHDLNYVVVILAQLFMVTVTALVITV